MPESAPLSIAPPEFGMVNYAVVALYMLAMLAVGIWAGRSTKGSAGYFTAEGKVHHVLVGISILGTYLSGLTMMALPALSYGTADWTWTVQLPFLLVTGFVITGFVLPRYREAGCLSVYEFLERRIHVSSRLIASASFIVLAIGRSGLVLYLPALAFNKVTGSNLIATILAMGVIVAVYTVLGGIKGVIWTDVIQVGIFVVGALATVYYVFALGGNVFAVANEYHKFRTLDLSLDVTKVVTAWLVLETIFQTIRIYSTQQEMTQRYMAAESTRKANASVWMSILGYIPLAYIFYFIGTGLFVYFHQHPDPFVTMLESQKKLDSLYAYFVVKHMPVGVAGLVIAAFFAAAMSTLSSTMNACSAVCIEDFYKRFRGRGRTDEHYLALAKGLCGLWGVLVIGMAILFMRVASAQVAWSKVMGVTTCGIAGLMALAFLPRRVNPWAAIVGFACGYLSLFLMMQVVQVSPSFALVWGIPKDCGLNFLLWPVVTNLVCFGVGLGLDCLFPRREPKPAPEEDTLEVVDVATDEQG